MDTTLNGTSELPVVSIVIPCYNSGKYLAEAIYSTEQYQGEYAHEVIIVDDGSSDQQTIKLLATLKASGYQVIHQENKGPAAARNAGVRLAKGKYILFLDSDNKIRPDYIDSSVPLFDQDATLGIVHGNASFFEDGGALVKPRFFPAPFDVHTIMAYNYIDMCAVIRVEAYRELGGLDEARVLIGHEDWEFWIRANSAGWKFRFINQILFDYRVRQDSLVMESVQSVRLAETRRYIFSKHSQVFLACYDDLRTANAELSLEAKCYDNDKSQPLRSFIKYSYHKMVKRTR